MLLKQRYKNNFQSTASLVEYVKTPLSCQHRPYQRLSLHLTHLCWDHQQWQRWAIFVARGAAIPFGLNLPCFRPCTSSIPLPLLRTLCDAAAF